MLISKTISQVSSTFAAFKRSPLGFLTTMHYWMWTQLFLLSFLLFLVRVWSSNLNFQLWNASQLEMVYHGKMHGFMRQVFAWILQFTLKMLIFLHILLSLKCIISFIHCRKKLQNFVQYVLGKKDSWVDKRTWRSPCNVHISKRQGKL